jgi:AraC-like DNA-binding protein
MNVGSILTLTPTINFARRDIAGANQTWGPRIIPDCQFFYVIEGEAELLLNQKQHRITAGQCVFYGADSPHHLRTVTDIIFYSVHFYWTHPSPEPVHPAHQIQPCSLSDLSRQSVAYELDVPIYGTVSIPHWFDVPGLEQVFMRIVKEYQLEQPGYPFMLRALLMELISILVRHVADQSFLKRTQKIEPALEAMRLHPEKEWTVEYLAKLCGYHPLHFSKLFKEEMGRTPKHYLITEKIKRAKQLLLGGESLEVIAGQLKYNNVHYFSHQFKKETGLRPTEFRQQGSRLVPPY